MNENIILLATNIFVFVLGGGMLLIIPQITRKSLLFGVKIPLEEAGCAEAIALRGRYIRTCLFGIFILLALCVAQFVLLPDWTLLTTLYMPLLIVPIHLWAFVPNWKAAVRLKQERGWQVSGAVFAETSSSNNRGNLSKLPWAWYIASLVVILVTIAITVAMYPALPDQIPGHMDANMQATRYVDKTWLSVLMLPLVNLATLAVIFIVGISIEKAKLQIDAKNPRVSFLQHAIYRRRMGNAMGFIAFGIVILMTIVGIPLIYPVSPDVGIIIFWGGMILFIAPIVVLIGVIIKTGQGGCKVKIDENEIAANTPAPTGPAFSGRGDDKHWILGMFYCNPDDPAIIVENRFGANLGLNYGRLSIKIGMGLLILSLVVMYVWLTVMFV